MLFLDNDVTVGVCAYNEGNNIGNLLQNILSEQLLSSDSEVLVVCSGCTDNTAFEVNKYSRMDPRVKVYFEDNRNGKASAINYIFSHAAKDIILFISADTLPQKNSFQKLLSKIREPNVGLVCGNPCPINNSKSLVGRVVRLMWRFHGHVFEELNDAGLARHASEAFCVRRGIVEKIPTGTVNDDAYIAVNVKKKGWLVKFCFDSRIYICGPKTFLEYFRQRRRVIFGHYQIRRLTSESPQYLLHMMPLHPVRTIRLLFWLVTKSDPLTLTTFLMSEFLVNVAATADFALGKNYSRWNVLPSTKSMLKPI